MKLFMAAAMITVSAAAHADTSCMLSPVGGGAPTALLLRELPANSEVTALVSGRTMIFECPPSGRSGTYECYGRTKPPIEAPTQLNITSAPLAEGAVVIVSVRNQFFGKNEHIGYHRRHASIHVFQIEACEGY